MTDKTVAEADLFAENFNEAVKNIVLVKQVMKNTIPTVEKSTSAEEHFYQESIYDLSGGTSLVVPRDADFPADQVKWTKITVRPRKFGIESRLSWEDTIVNAIDVPARTTMRVANAVARAVDSRIWDVVSENRSAVNINTVAATATWNNATRANRIPHEDIAKAIRLISDSQTQSYEPDTLLVSPLDYVSANAP